MRRWHRPLIAAIIALRLLAPAPEEAAAVEPVDPVVGPPIAGMEIPSTKEDAAEVIKAKRSRLERLRDRWRERVRERRQRRRQHDRILERRERHHRWKERKATRIAARAASRVHRLLGLAKSMLGTPYAFGAAGPYAFDCSGFTSWLYRHFGVYLPHSARMQYYAVKHVSTIEPGDLLFFSYGRLGSGVVDHVEIALTRYSSIGTSNSVEDLDIDPIDWDSLVGIGRP